MSWREQAAALPNLAPVEFDVNASMSALVVVDMQYLDAHRDYGLGVSLRKSHPEVWNYYFRRIEELVVPNIRNLLDAFRRLHIRVIHLTVGPELPDGTDLLPARRGKTTPSLASQVYHKGTFEHQILPEVAPTEGELVVNKTSRGAFNSTGFGHTLRNMGIETLIMAGVTTCSCIETTARDAADRGLNVVLVDDAMAELDEASHDATMKQFVTRWGRVWTTKETLTIMASLREQTTS